MPLPSPIDTKKGLQFGLLYLCEDLFLAYMVGNGGNTDFIIFLLAFY